MRLHTVYIFNILFHVLLCTAVRGNPLCKDVVEFLGRPEGLNLTAAEFAVDNKEGGFLASKSRMYFAHPKQNPQVALLEELGVKSPPLGLAQLPGWDIHDVTDSPVLSRQKHLQSIFSVYDGVRCYSAAFLCLGFAQGAINASPKEFKLWANSPLAQDVTGDKARAGDVIAVGEKGTGIPVSHVATYQSPNIIFQKRSPQASDPFEYVTKQSFDAHYSKSDYKNQKLFRPTETLTSYIERNKAALPVDLLKSLETITQIEKSTDTFLLTRRAEPNYPMQLPEAENLKWANAFHDALLIVEKRASAIETTAAAQLSLLKNVDNKKAEKFLWEYVLLRAQSLQAYPDPFN